MRPLFWPVVNTTNTTNMGTPLLLLLTLLATGSADKFHEKSSHPPSLKAVFKAARAEQFAKLMGADGERRLQSGDDYDDDFSLALLYCPTEWTAYTDCITDDCFTMDDDWESSAPTAAPLDDGDDGDDDLPTTCSEAEARILADSGGGACFSESDWPSITACGCFDEASDWSMCHYESFVYNAIGLTCDLSGMCAVGAASRASTIGGLALGMMAMVAWLI